MAARQAYESLLATAQILESKQRGDTEMIFSPGGDELLKAFNRLRNVRNSLIKELTRRLPRNSVLESAKKLGLAKGKTLIFGSDQDAAVLFDYCIFNSRQGGKTVIERYAEKSPPQPHSDEDTVLRAMMHSFFSIFRILEVQRGKGVLFDDFFRKDKVFLMDSALSVTAETDMAFAGRLLPFDDFHLSSGAFLPLFEEPAITAVVPIMEEWRSHHPDMGRKKLSPGLEASFSAQIIRAALRAGALESIVYSGFNETEE